MSAAEILVTLRKSASVSDSTFGLINLLHTQAEAVVKEYLGFHVEATTHTEYYPVRDYGLFDAGVTRSGNPLLLKNRPVRTITSVHEDTGGYFGQGTSAFAASTALTVGTDFVWVVDYDRAADGTDEASRSGKLIRLRTDGWPTAPGSVRVIYTAGWEQANIPGGIRGGICQTVAAWFSRISDEHGNHAGRLVLAERLGDYSVTFFDGMGRGTNASLPPEAEAMLRPWKRIRI